MTTGIARFAQWLRRLNHKRLAQRKAAKQRAADHAWLVADDPHRLQIARSLQARAEALRDGPLLSVVVLPDSTRPARLPTWPWTGAASPWYPNWELLLADAEPHVSNDSRVRRVACDAACSATQRFAAAVRAARGEAIVAVPSDALLAPHAPLLFAEALRHFKGSRVIYSDHDSMDPRGRRQRPQMLCDWNQELLRSTFYLQGAIVLRRDVLLPLVDLPGVEESVHWRDLIFRLTEHVSDHAVVHIPHVLWHRLQSGHSQPEPPLALASAHEVAAVQDHLDRIGCDALAAKGPEGGVHVRYAVPQPAPLVSLIIPTRNGLSLLRQCMQSIFDRTHYPRYEIVIVDNGSDDPATVDYLRSLSGDPRVRVHRDDRPFNFSSLNNAAARLCRGELLGLVNNDIEVIDALWLDEMVGIALRADVGAVGARLWFADETLQHAGVILGIAGVAGHVHRQLPRGQPGYLGRALVAQEFSAVTAACLVLRKQVFDAVHGLDEQHLAVDYNDIDLCLRIRSAGYRIVWTPHAQLFHHESATRGLHRPAGQQQRYDREVQWMQTRWGATLQNDPAYNPNLSLQSTRFGLAPQPRVELASRWFDHSPPGTGPTPMEGGEAMR